eukprot:s175_g24.t1
MGSPGNLVTILPPCSSRGQPIETTAVWRKLWRMATHLWSRRFSVAFAHSDRSLRQRCPWPGWSGTPVRFHGAATPSSSSSAKAEGEKVTVHFLDPNMNGLPRFSLKHAERPASSIGLADKDDNDDYDDDKDSSGGAAAALLEEVLRGWPPPISRADGLDVDVAGSTVPDVPGTDQRIAAANARTSENNLPAGGPEEAGLIPVDGVWR